MRQYTDTEKAEIVARAKVGESVSALSRELSIPRSTLRGWIRAELDPKTAEKKEKKRVDIVEKGGESKARACAKKNTRACVDASPGRQGGESDTKEEKNDQSTQSERKQSFSDSSWDNIEKAHKIINRRLNRALDNEDALDKIVDIVWSINEKDLSYEQKLSLLSKLRRIKVEDVREMVILIGTLYDKQALANGEVNGKIGLEQEKPFEIVVTVKQ